MDTATIDIESYYGDDYTLSKMTTEAYIRDPRAELILGSVKFNAAPSQWVLPERFAPLVQEEIDWSNTALVNHHSHFDGAWLAWHYGVTPALYIDTLSMARVIDGPKAGNSLRDLCIRHGIGYKGDYVTQAKGKHLADFDPRELQAYGEYCNNDCDRTYDLAQIFLPQIPPSELKLIDATIRMFTEPQFIGDVDKLAAAVASERQRKIDLLRRINLLCPTCGGCGFDPNLTLIPGTDAAQPVCKKCDGTGVDKKPIGSNEQFANLLRGFGEEPQTKESPSTGQQIYAFARTDSYMQSLLEDADEEVRFLAEARIGVKSNIILTRAQRFHDCALRGPIPAYLKHAGAHTLRPAGGDSMNMLNMSNQIEDAPRPEMAVLKESIMAPPGSLIVAADSGQGEARILAWLANQHDLVEAFAQGRDIYSEEASDIYRRPVNRKLKSDYIAGQVGKICILSFGFGAGYYTAAQGFLKGVLGAPPIQFVMADLEALGVDPSAFLNNPNKLARVEAMPSRLDLNDRLIHCIVTEALIKRYRTKYQAICGKTGFWQQCEQAIGAMIRGEEMVFGAHGVLRTGKDCIYLPVEGLKLNYRGLERSESDGNATFWDGRKRTKIYGSLLTENIVQCLHRLVVGGQLLEINEMSRVALWPYDEIVTVVPEDAAATMLEFMISVMKTSPPWAIGLPLKAEGGIGRTYAAAK